MSPTLPFQKGATMQVRIIITLKASIPDAAGQMIQHTLKQRGFDVAAVRAGKLIELECDDNTPMEALEEMCQRLLANPVIEEYHIEIIPPSASAAPAKKKQRKKKKSPSTPGPAQ